MTSSDGMTVEVIRSVNTFMLSGACHFSECKNTFLTIAILSRSKTASMCQCAKSAVSSRARNYYGFSFCHTRQTLVTDLTVMPKDLRKSKIQSALRRLQRAHLSNTATTCDGTSLKLSSMIMIKKVQLQPISNLLQRDNCRY